jgi:hypothetical protein
MQSDGAILTTHWVHQYVDEHNQRDAQRQHGLQTSTACVRIPEGICTLASYTMTPKSAEIKGLRRGQQVLINSSCLVHMH